MNFPLFIHVSKCFCPIWGGGGGGGGGGGVAKTKGNLEL